MHKKSILAVIAIIILMGASLSFPWMISYYSDKSHMDKIKYAKSKDIDIFSVKNSRSMLEKFKLISDFASSEYPPDVIELDYSISEEKMQGISEKVTEEIKFWINKDIINKEFMEIDLSRYNDISILNIDLYNVNGSLSYLKIEAVTKENPEALITVYVDSTDYKIYLMTIEGDIVKKWRSYWYIGGMYVGDTEKSSEYLVKEFSSLSDSIMEYYNIDATMSVGEGKTQNGEKIVYDIDVSEYSDVEWSIQFDIDSMPKMYIGITAFADDFAGDNLYDN